MSKLLPAVSMVAVPLVWGVHRYQTDFPPSSAAWFGSPGSLVALWLLPLVVAPASSRALAKSSLVSGLRPAAAEAMLILLFVTPPATRVSVTGVPVLCKADRMLGTEAVGFCCLSSAHAPATCGAAMEVPLKAANC